MEMNQDAKEILLKQLQLLQEESEKTRNEGDVCERPRNLACLSEAMARVASVMISITEDPITAEHADASEKSKRKNGAYPNIDAERSRKGMTNDQLASELGITRKTLYNWMHNGNIPQSKLEQMATIFDCSIDYLLCSSPYGVAGRQA